VWSAPTIDVSRKLVYAATGNSFTGVEIPTSDAVLAFDLETGKLVWTSQVDTGDNYTMACGPEGKANCPAPKGGDTDFGTSPALVNLGRKQIIVVGQKSGVLWGLDPDNKGKVLWHAQVGKGGPLGGIEWGHAVDGTIAYAPISDRYQKDAKGLISGVDLHTGKILWTTDTPDTGCKPGAPGCQTAMSAAVSAIPGAVFAGAVDGHMRAYDKKTGTIIWDYDANHAFETVNKVPGKGGSFDAPGPVIVNGMLLTASGYSMWGGAGGNVLLAFTVDGK
jgi:polyvinyl alcohol dehydrogenase (cytochrome)